MQHKIIMSHEAKDAVKDLLKETKDSAQKIALLNMEEVSLYIDIVHAMQTHLENTINTGLVVLRSTQSSKINGLWGAAYNGYHFLFGTSPYPNRDQFKILNMSIEPTPPFEKYQNILIELQQRKRYLENLEKIEDKLIQKGSVSRFHKIIRHALPSNPLSELPQGKFEEEKENIRELDFIEESIKDAQDQVALDALHSYHDVLNQSKNLNEQLEKQKIQGTQKASLLEDALSQNEKLQQDMKALQSELASTLKENKRIMEEKQKADDTIVSTKSRIAEQESELSRLKKIEFIPVYIQRADFVSLLNKFNYHSSFFSKEERGLEGLKKLIEAKSESISSQQIRNSIKDMALLKIFDDPHLFNNSAALTRQGLIMRELAFTMRYQDLPKSFESKINGP